MKIGENLAALMESHHMDRETLCDYLKWTMEHLESILNNENSPGVSELLMLANIFGTDISSLLYGHENQEKVAIKTTKGDRVGVDIKGLLHYESLAPGYAGRHLEPFVVDVYHHREEDLEVMRHSGEEFHYVLSGHVQITVDGTVYDLEAGDSFYFDSSHLHSINSVTEHSRTIAAIYNRESMVHMTKGEKMRGLISAAKLFGNRAVVLVCPDNGNLTAVNRGIEEHIVETVYLVGCQKKIRERCGSELIYEKNYVYIEIDESGSDPEMEAARAGVKLIREGKGQMIMKGQINTATFIKAILSDKSGISSGKRLSLVCLFEIPGVDRIILLTDPGINPELFSGNDLEAGADIIENALDVARSIGIERPKVALLEANEVPSDKLPTTMMEQNLSERVWKEADVYGPLSYDLALYKDSVEKKGMEDNPVAGKANILVVPTVASGNFLYKTWVFTMGAEVANVVMGATVPIILTSRSDSDITKFLTICAGAIYSHFVEEQEKKK